MFLLIQEKKSNILRMAIPMTEGSNSIVFKYNPIENLICLTISLVFITVFIVYVFVSRKNIQKQKV